MKQKNRHMEMRALPCQITDEELEVKHGELARVTMEERDHQDAIAAFVERHKSEKKRMEQKLAEKTGARLKLAKEITTRKMDRDVACDWRFDLESDEAILVRRDTGAAVARRKMHAEERQTRIGEVLEGATVVQLAEWRGQLDEAAKQGLDVDETPAPAPTETPREPGE